MAEESKCTRQKTIETHMLTQRTWMKPQFIAPVTSGMMDFTLIALITLRVPTTSSSDLNPLNMKIVWTSSRSQNCYKNWTILTLRRWKRPQFQKIAGNMMWFSLFIQEMKRRPTMSSSKTPKTTLGIYTPTCRGFSCNLVSESYLTRVRINFGKVGHLVRRNRSQELARRES